MGKLSFGTTGRSYQPAEVKLAVGGAPQCPRCTKRVYYNEEKRALGKVWHTSCFHCAKCKKRLDSTNCAGHENEIYCWNCHKKEFGPRGYGFAGGAAGLSTDATADKGLSSSPVQTITVPAHIPDSQAGNVKDPECCPRCGKKVFFAEEVTAHSRKWHRLCFKCNTCNKMLEKGRNSERQGDVYCSSCYGRQFGPSGYGYAGGAGTLLSSDPYYLNKSPGTSPGSSRSESPESGATAPAPRSSTSSYYPTRPQDDASESTEMMHAMADEDAFGNVNGEKDADLNSAGKQALVSGIETYQCVEETPLPSRNALPNGKNYHGVQATESPYSSDNGTYAYTDSVGTTGTRPAATAASDRPASSQRPYRRSYNDNYAEKSIPPPADDIFKTSQSPVHSRGSSLDSPYNPYNSHSERLTHPASTGINMTSPSPVHSRGSSLDVEYSPYSSNSERFTPPPPASISKPLESPVHSRGSSLDSPYSPYNNYNDRPTAPPSAGISKTSQSPVHSRGSSLDTPYSPYNSYNERPTAPLSASITKTSQSPVHSRDSSLDTPYSSRNSYTERSIPPPSAVMSKPSQSPVHSRGSSLDTPYSPYTSHNETYSPSPSTGLYKTSQSPVNSRGSSLDTIRSPYKTYNSPTERSTPPLAAGIVKTSQSPVHSRGSSLDNPQSPYKTYSNHSDRSTPPPGILKNSQSPVHSRSSSSDALYSAYNGKGGERSPSSAGILQNSQSPVHSRSSSSSDAPYNPYNGDYSERYTAPGYTHESTTYRPSYSPANSGPVTPKIPSTYRNGQRSQPPSCADDIRPTASAGYVSAHSPYNSSPASSGYASAHSPHNSSQRTPDEGRTYLDSSPIMHRANPAPATNPPNPANDRISYGTERLDNGYNSHSGYTPNTQQQYSPESRTPDISSLSMRDVTSVRDPEIEKSYSPERNRYSPLQQKQASQALYRALDRHLQNLPAGGNNDNYSPLLDRAKPAPVNEEGYNTQQVTTPPGLRTDGVYL